MLAAMPVVHHLLANAVMDSDMYILHVQGRNLRRLERSGKSWEQGFFMPTSADNEIVEFRRWFHGPGQNGPKAPNGTRLIEVLAAIPRRVAMDRYRCAVGSKFCWHGLEIGLFEQRIWCLDNCLKFRMTSILV